MNYDYAATRAALKESIQRLSSARDAAGRTNLPPAMNPADARRQIDVIDEILREAKEYIDVARDACAAEARRGLSVVD